MQNQTEVRPFFDVLTELWKRRKWLFILTFITVLAGAVTLISQLPDMYRASTRVLVQQDPVAESFVKSSVTTALNSRLQAAQLSTMSRANLMEVIERHDLYPDARDKMTPDILVRHMRRDTTIQIDRMQNPQWQEEPTLAFSISYQGWDPELVAAVTNDLATLYIQEANTMSASQATATREFLKKQVDQAYTELSKEEERLNQYKTEFGGALPEQQNVNLATLTRLYGELQRNGMNQMQLIDSRDGVVNGVGGVASTDKGVQLARLQNELANLQSLYTDRHPDVIRVKTEIERIRRSGVQTAPGSGEAGTPAADGSYGSLASELAALKQEEQRLREQIELYQSRVENVPQIEQELAMVLRDYNFTKDRYLSLLQRYDDARLAESLERQEGNRQFKVLETAEPPQMPVGPNKLKLLIIAMALASLSAAALVLLREQFDNTFHSVQDLKNFTSVPIAATIPRITTPGDNLQKGLRACFVAFLAIVNVMLIMRVFYYFGNGNEQLVTMLVQRGI